MRYPISSKYWQKAISLFVIVTFILTGFNIPLAQAQEFHLPKPGVMVHLSPEFNPPILKGIKVHADNPFRFEFILDKGDSNKNNDQLKEESSKLIKYFLASLTIPEKDLWVNLSPYEKDRIIPNSFGLTEMGRDLLAQDYMLKQITASLIYPEDEIGKKFWKRIYEESSKKYGTTNIPVNTFNKVWIVPEKAVVYENAKAGTAYVVESRLKVMLEQDYLSLQKHEGETQSQVKETNQLGSQVIREIVIPELTKEVNENKNFTQLRQVYNSLILATWYKKKIKDSILSQVYADKNKVMGVNIDNHKEKEKIYQQYLQAFKKGVYSYIKEEQDHLTGQPIPRKYFSGGATFFGLADKAMVIMPVGGNVVIDNAPNSMLTVSTALNVIGAAEESRPFKTQIPQNPEMDGMFERGRSLIQESLNQELVYLRLFRGNKVLAMNDIEIPSALKGMIGETGKVVQIYDSDLLASMRREAPDVMEEETAKSFLVTFNQNGDVFKIYLIAPHNMAYALDELETENQLAKQIKVMVVKILSTQAQANKIQTSLDQVKNQDLHTRYGNILIPFGVELNLVQSILKHPIARNLLSGLQGRVSLLSAGQVIYVSGSQVGYDDYEESLFQESQIDEELIAHLTQMVVMDQKEKPFDYRSPKEKRNHWLRGLADSNKLITGALQGQRINGVFYNPKLYDQGEQGVLGTIVHEIVHLYLKEALAQVRPILLRIKARHGDFIESLSNPNGLFFNLQLSDEDQKDLREVGILPRVVGDEAMVAASEFYSRTLQPTIGTTWSELDESIQKMIGRHVDDPDLIEMVKASNNEAKNSLAWIVRVVTQEVLFKAIYESMAGDFDREQFEKQLFKIGKLHGEHAATFFAILNVISPSKRPKIEDISKIMIEESNHNLATGRHYYVALKTLTFLVTKDNFKEVWEQIGELLDSVFEEGTDYFLNVTLPSFKGLIKTLADLKKFYTIFRKAIDEDELEDIDTSEFLLALNVVKDVVKTLQDLRGVAKIVVELENSLPYYTNSAYILLTALKHIIKTKDDLVAVHKALLRIKKKHEEEFENLCRYGFPSIGSSIQKVEDLETAADQLVLLLDSAKMGSKETVEHLVSIMESSQKIEGDQQHGSAFIVAGLWQIFLADAKFFQEKSTDERTIWVREVLRKFGKYTVKQLMEAKIEKSSSGDKLYVNEYLSMMMIDEIKPLFDRLTAVPLEEAQLMLNEALPDDEQYGKFLLAMVPYVLFFKDRKMRDILISKRTRKVIASLGEKEAEVSYLPKLLVGGEMPEIDLAMLNIPIQVKSTSDKNFTKGGIDLTPVNMNLQTKNSGNEFKFHIDPAMLKQLQNAPGFYPVIINIQPMTDLQMFLGLKN